MTDVNPFSGGFFGSLVTLFGKKLNKTPPNPADNQIIRFNFALDRWELSTGGILSAVQSSSNVGAGAGLALPRVGDDLPFKSIIANSPLSLVSNPTDITISISNIPLNLLVALTANRALESSISGEIIASVVTNTELGLLSGRVAKLVSTNEGNIYGALDQVFRSSNLKFRNPLNTQSYVFIGSGILGDRNITLPNLLAGDTFVFQAFNQPITNKQIILSSNTLIDTARATGDIPKDNGTKYVRFPRGTALQQIRVNAGGTDIEYFTPPAPPATPPPSFLLNQYNETVTLTSDRHFAIVGKQIQTGGIGASKTSFPNACKLARLTVRISNNATTGDSTFLLNVNGVDTLLSVTITAGVNGNFQDLVNVINISNVDEVVFIMRKGAGGDIILRSAGLEVLAP